MIFYPLNKRKFYNSNDFWQENCFQFKFEGVILPHVEMHLVDFCNLNCKGCSHFSALYDKKIPDKDKRIADIYKLNEMFDTIYRLYLLGGEPLLNPDICDYVTRIRRILPTTVISIITNGLMIPSMTDEFFRCLHDNRVNVYITMYEPTKKIIDKIYDKLENFKVDHAIYSNNNGKFLRILAETKDSGMAHYCGANGCTCVCDGKISRCPQLMFVNKLNEKMQTNFPTTGIIDLNDVSDGAKLLKMLDRKVELCEYCVYSEIKWEPCGKIVKKEDFVNVLN
jgi:organic radical activating enzyme